MTLFSLFRFPSVELDVASEKDPGSRALGGRYCRILTAEPDDELLVLAWHELEKNMTIVPAGKTKLATATPGLEAALDGPRQLVSAEHVEAFYVDRHTVSNDQFASFVEDDGYSQPELWAPQALAHLLQFVDRTGNPGPRYWSKCQPPKGQGNHPVVGVCWYEALAFARWSGKQLPSPAQWQWAGIWARQDGSSMEAKYPWGSAFDPHRANTWASGIGESVPVDEYYDGSTPNGVFQLVGNVWEWVSGSFCNISSGEPEQLAFKEPPGEIRGGAFDTYLETQSSCRFRSCQPRFYRGSNVGFRCCLPLAGLPTPPDPAGLMSC